MILGATPVEFASQVVEGDFTQAVFTGELAKALSDAAAAQGKTAKVHIKLDTGMSRLGLLAHDPIEAAKEAFATLGRVAGDAMATAVTLMDGVIVIGGGLAGASKYFMPALIEEMRGKINTLSGDTLNRVQMSVYNLDDEEEFAKFAKGNSTKIKVYGSDEEVVYDPEKRVGITISDIGASNAVSLGAYLYAIDNI
jgi:predicted NBD/HSP70 family sugar kinase